MKHRAAAKHPSSQAEDLRTTSGHSKQPPQVLAKRLVVKLSVKAPSTGQSIAPQLQVKQAPNASLLKLPTNHVPQKGVVAHMPRSSKSSSVKAFKAAPIERPITRRFKLQQRSQLKLRIKLKKTAETDQQPQRASTLKHQQKRHGQQAHDNILKHDSLLVNATSGSKTCLLQSAPDKLPDCAQTHNLLGVDTRGTSPMTQITASTMGSRPKNNAGSKCSHLQPVYGTSSIAVQAETQSTVPRTLSTQPKALWSGSKPPLGPSKPPLGPKHHLHMHALPAEHQEAGEQAGLSREQRWGLFAQNRPSVLTICLACHPN